MSSRRALRIFARIRCGGREVVELVTPLRYRVETLGTVTRRRALLVLGEAKTTPLGLDLRTAEARHDFGHLDVRNLLDVAAGKDDVDLLEGTTGGLRVEEVNDGKAGQKKPGTLARVLDDETRAA